MNTTTSLYILSGIMLAAAFLLGIWFGVRPLASRSVGSVGIEDAGTASSQQTDACQFRSRLNGVCVSSEDETHPDVVLVMIENHFESWPQSGLSDASIVYEAPTEGNITRFLAVYPLGVAVHKAGPVRSARPYFLSWALEYGKPLYFHVGGSNDALGKIRNQGNITDVDEFFRAQYFWRSRDRLAPHNTYTSSTLWESAAHANSRAADAALGDAGVWQFTSALSEAEREIYPDAGKITVSFAPPTYEAVWMYASSTGAYERQQMKKSHRDEDGRLIRAETVAVMHVKSRVLDDVGRLSIETIGKGTGVVFRDGQAITGEWRKMGETDRTRWYDNDGNEIAFKPGHIWIEVVPQTGGVSFESRYHPLPPPSQGGDSE